MLKLISHLKSIQSPRRSIYSLEVNHDRDYATKSDTKAQKGTLKFEIFEQTPLVLAFDPIFSSLDHYTNKRLKLSENTDIKTTFQYKLKSSENSREHNKDWSCGLLIGSKFKGRTRSNRVECQHKTP
jgi:hypothetical protein